MTKLDSLPVALIGCGYMGREYLKVLRSLNRPFTVHGRGQASAEKFEADTGVRPFAGSLSEQFKELGGFPDTAIVAVTTDSLAPVVTELLEGGTRSILVEKPAGLTPAEVAEVAALDVDDRVTVAYNRRFYPSVSAARKIIAEDGGVTSFAFEFTERSDIIRQTKHAAPLKQTWFFGNSTHVVDLAFFLAGVEGDPSPIRFASTLVAGELDWHPAASRFAGCGTTGTDTLFSYRADWGSGGRWTVEINTANRRLILAPLEKLATQKRGEFDIHLVDDLPAEPVEGCKPGLAEMTAAFLSGNPDGRFLTLRDQAKRLAAFNQMLYPQG